MGYDARANQRRVIDAVNQVIEAQHAQVDQLDKLTAAFGVAEAAFNETRGVVHDNAQRLTAQGAMVIDLEKKVDKRAAEFKARCEATDARVDGVRMVVAAIDVRITKAIDAQGLINVSLDGDNTALHYRIRAFEALTFLGRLRWLFTGRL